MLDWDKLRIFHTAAESGSFTHAAEKLIGQQLHDLGKRAKLLHLPELSAKVVESKLVFL